MKLYQKQCWEHLPRYTSLHLLISDQIACQPNVLFASNSSIWTIFFLIVSDTAPPIVIAPRVSMNVAKIKHWNFQWARNLSSEFNLRQTRFYVAIIDKRSKKKISSSSLEVFSVITTSYLLLIRSITKE